MTPVGLLNGGCLLLMSLVTPPCVLGVLCGVVVCALHEWRSLAAEVVSESV